MTKTPFTRAKKISTARQIFGAVPRLPVPRGLGTTKILSTGATLHFGPIRLNVENLGVPCLKIVSTVPKIWRAVIFFARVNGAFNKG